MALPAGVVLARDKLQRKKLDMIAANQVGPGLGFEGDDNALLLLWEGGSEDLGMAAKAELARLLVARIASRFQSTRARRDHA